MNILVIGSNGQLGSEIKDIAVNYKDFNFLFKDLPELNICKDVALNTFILNQDIDVVINCAAYTAVDKAEENAEIAEQVNSFGVLNLVKALEKVNGKLIHISTDYVFDGSNSEPYKESDHVNPLGVYGKTKREGELFVINSTIDSIIIRTSWLYSSFGKNFVKTMYKLGSEKNSLNVISDQIGSPTYARDLAKFCLDILSSKTYGRISSNGKIYHFSNEGVASWYDFAKAIMELGLLDCKVSPIETKDYPTMAKRPRFSLLNKSKIKTDFNIQIPYWRDSLDKCIEKLKSN
jgi:dTDP-4-dehydrorhamnose reductase